MSEPTTMKEEWSCSRCTFSNPSHRERCEVCESKRGRPRSKAQRAKQDSASKTEPVTPGRVIPGALADGILADKNLGTSNGRASEQKPEPKANCPTSAEEGSCEPGVSNSNYDSSESETVSDLKEDENVSEIEESKVLGDLTTNTRQMNEVVEEMEVDSISGKNLVPVGFKEH